MRLIDYMREKGLDDAAMAALVGGITEHGIRKLKYGERNPSIEVAARIASITHGAVVLDDWIIPHGPPDGAARNPRLARRRATPGQAPKAAVAG